MFAFYNFSLRPIHIKKGERIGQGWFGKVYLVDDDEPVNRERKSGFNSTGA